MSIDSEFAIKEAVNELREKIEVLIGICNTIVSNQKSLETKFNKVDPKGGNK